jgi:hypothetical protein
MKGEPTAVTLSERPHQTQPCAVCDARPQDQSDGVMGATEPPEGWAGEPVPICDDCANDNAEAPYLRSVAIGKARFWVGPKTINACAGSIWRDWEPGDTVVAMPSQPGAWWNRARYGEVEAVSAGKGNVKGHVTVRWSDGETTVHLPGDLLDKTDPYEEH